MNKWPFRRTVPSVQRIIFGFTLPQSEQILVHEAQRAVEFIQASGFHVEAVGLNGINLTLTARTTFASAVASAHSTAVAAGRIIGATSARAFKPIAPAPVDGIPPNPEPSK
jgi:hypothetical protein